MLWRTTGLAQRYNFRSSTLCGWGYQTKILKRRTNRKDTEKLNPGMEKQYKSKKLFSDTLKKNAFVWKYHTYSLANYYRNQDGDSNIMST